MDSISCRVGFLATSYFESSCCAPTFRPAWVVVEAINATTTSWLTKARPRQFCVIWQKSRCSILFHLLVAGGKWQTLISKPISWLSRARHHFQRWQRELLLPPPSAVISSFVAFGYCGAPIFDAGRPKCTGSGHLKSLSKCTTIRTEIRSLFEPLKRGLDGGHVKRPESEQTRNDTKSL